MKKILLTIFFGCVGGLALAQYVANTTVQNQILKDQAIINSCEDAINNAQADINAIENDNSATAITAETPAIQAIQSVAAQPVSANTAMPAVNGT